MKPCFSFFWKRRVLGASLLVGLVPAGVAHATTYTVTNIGDSGAGSLRQAIVDANNAATNDAIVFDATAFAGTFRQGITLASALPDIAANGTLSISAPASGITLYGGYQYRVFTIAPNANATFTSLSIVQGRVDLNGAGNTSGGGIWNKGTLTLEGCSVADNIAQDGAGIYSGNPGGAAPSLTMRNCTFSGNLAQSRGGALFNAGSASLDSCTLSNNASNTLGGGSGIATLDISSGVLTQLKNSIVAGNTNTDMDSVGGNNTLRTQSNGTNLVGDGNQTGAFSSASGDKIIGDGATGLDYFNGNGGPVNTFAIFPSSPAYNAGSTTLSTDARGIIRPQNGAPDIGAFELKFNTPPVVDLNGTGAGIDNTASYTENNTVAGRPLIALPAVVTDENSTSNDGAAAGRLDSIFITISNLQDGASESLSASAAGLSGTTITQSYTASTGELYLRGGATVADFQKVLRTVRYYNTSQNPNTTPRVITVVALDNQSVFSATAKTTISITPVNDPPVAFVPNDVNGAPITQTANEDTPLVFSLANGNQVGAVDLDDAGQVEEVSISVLHGTLSLKQTTGLTFSVGSGTGNATMTFRGTVTIENDAQGNATVAGGTVGRALDGLVYTPNPNFNGSDTLSISINDLGNTGTGGPLSSSATLPLSIVAINDAPVNSVPGAATTPPNTGLVFNAANGNRISVSDVDAGTSAFSVTLTAQNGRITLGTSPANLTIMGNGTANVSLGGTLADINAALDGLTFSPDTNYSGGNASLTIASNDNGNTGSGGVLSDSDVISISVNAPLAPSALISEFRVSGPNGASDEFIELANPTRTPVDLGGWMLTVGSVLVTIPAGRSIPAGGHFLITNSGGYSLSGLAVGDVSYTGDIAAGSTLTLKNAGGALVDTLGNLLATASPSSSTNQYSFVRRLESGVPAKTGNDTNDFNLVDTRATSSTSGATGVGPLTAPRLGAPGPQNTLSPIQRNDKIGFVPINAATVGTPAEGRYASKNSLLDSPNGRLTLRRTITNNTGAAVTQMRFRIVAATSGTSTASGVADLRALTSAGVTMNGTKVVQGITLDAPSTPTVAPSGFGNNTVSSGNGGGLNSSWSVVTLPSGGLADKGTINVEFLFAIVQNGTYRVVVDTELVP